MAYSYMHNPEVWDIDRSHEVKRRTWWWYWWIFYLDNPRDPRRPRQLMVLWATRNARKVHVNGKKWVREKDIKKGRNNVSFTGLTAGWYFDGKRMHEPLFQHSGPIKAFWSDEHGEVTTEKWISARFFYSNMAYHLKVEDHHKDFSIDMKMTRWTDELSRAVPTGRQYLGNLGYRMYKIRGMKVNGKILHGNRNIEVKGTAYFQKVRINSPTSPWYWGAFHGPDGEYMDYFMPHIGMPIFRRGLSHRSIFDWGEKHLSNNLQYFDPEKKEYHHFEGLKISREYEKDLPIFTFRGENREESIRVRIRAYSRAHWKIKQPWLGILSTVLVYNEYPAFVEDFEIKGPHGRITLDDIGNFVGNAEHSWGIV